VYLFKKVILLTILFLTFFSCSLNYGTEQNPESSVPEFTFSQVAFIRYEDNKMSMDLTAEKLEQYKNDGSSFAKNAYFKTYDKDGILDTDGFCGLLSVNSKNEIYSLFDGISIKIYSQELSITADSLRFNAKTEQLTSGIDQTVTISKKDTSVSGTGFSASGVSRQYSFSNKIEGTVIEKDRENVENEEEEKDEYHTESQNE